jgi:hypothetical protein
MLSGYFSLGNTGDLAFFNPIPSGFDAARAHVPLAGEQRLTIGKELKNSGRDLSRRQTIRFGGPSGRWGPGLAVAEVR